MRLTLQLDELGWGSPRACNIVVRLAYFPMESLSLSDACWQQARRVFVMTCHCLKVHAK